MKKQAGVLLILLVCSLLLVSLLGAGLKLGLGRMGSYWDKPLVAVPFLFLRDDGLNWAQQRPGRADPQGTAPSVKETEPAAVTEPTEDTPAASIPETTSVPETVGPLAVYGQDEHYFDDALFIGDSRMEAMAEYARLGEADYFTSVGMTVFRLFSEKVFDDNFEKTDLESLLKTRTYGKVYIMLGLNEAGYPLDSLMEAYKSCVDQIRTLQPEAKVFLLQIYGVSREKAAETSYLVPENLEKINSAIAGFCDDGQVICLDPRGLYEDGEGYLQEECTSDGVHPYIKELDQFAQWLCEQAS